MDLAEVLKNAATEPEYLFERKLNELIIKNHNFYNLNQENKKLIMELIRKHKPMIRKYGGISSVTIREEEYRLFQNRMKLHLTEEDLKEIKQILEYFKK